LQIFQPAISITSYGETVKTDYPLQGCYQKRIKHFVQDDGSLLLVLQPRYTRRILSRSNHIYYDTYAFDIHIIKLTPGRELEWTQVIPLTQTEPSSKRYCGAIAILHNRKELFVFFHDFKKNTGPQPDEKAKTVVLEGSWKSIQLTAFHVKGNGSMNRVPVTNGSTDEHRLAPFEPYIIYDDEIIYTSFDHRNGVHQNQVIIFKQKCHLTGWHFC
jgi:hypothetical protein